MPTLSFRVLVLLQSALLVMIVTAGCAWYMPPPLAIPGAASLVFDVTPVVTQPVIVIPVTHPLTLRQVELSGMAWYGDTLILLPQFPERFANQIFGLSKAAIADYLLGRDVLPLEPQIIYLDDQEVQQQITGAEGYEAIAFDGNRAYLTMEASRLNGMLGYVVTGEMVPEQHTLVLDPTHLASIEPQADLDNMADEALFLIHDQVATIYEANGFLVNSEPIVHLFDSVTLTQIGVTPFPNIEYRITDTTALDENGRFWAMNQFSPQVRRVRRFLQARGATGPINVEAQPVERLLEFQVTEEGIVRTDTPPIALDLLPNLDATSDPPSNWIARNWEGVVRFETADLQGFLIVTDHFPETILAFVPMPGVTSMK